MREETLVYSAIGLGVGLAAFAAIISARALQKVTAILERLHEDNVKTAALLVSTDRLTARELRHADKTVTRKVKAGDEGEAP